MLTGLVSLFISGCWFTVTHCISFLMVCGNENSLPPKTTNRLWVFDGWAVRQTDRSYKARKLNVNHTGATVMSRDEPEIAPEKDQLVGGMLFPKHTRLALPLSNSSKDKL